jgi:gamma-carbonic anhydrase
VARGDVNFIRVGARTNIQDGTVLHVTHVEHPLIIGAGVVVGHQAVVHGCTIEDGALIGIGARVLDGAVVERGAQIGAGAVVAPGHRIPAGHLALGIPARVARPLTEEETRRIAETAERYAELKEHYREALGAGTGRKETT